MDNTKIKTNPENKDHNLTHTNQRAKTHLNLHTDTLTHRHTYTYNHEPSHTQHKKQQNGKLFA